MFQERNICLFSGGIAYAKREVFTVPNAVTAVRLVCTIAMFVYGREVAASFYLALVGAVSDAIDGYLAKRFNWGTKFGQHFDQYVDWLFGIALLWVIFLNSPVEYDAWPFNLELLILIGGYLLLRALFPKLETIFIAKVKTFLQFAGGVIILCGLAYTWQECIVGGYLVVWSSIALMGMSLVYYVKNYLATRT